MTYCKEIQTILEAADVIRVSSEKYQGDVRMQKYKVLALANHFSGKKTDLGRFNERRCKPGLNDTDVKVLNAEVSNTIKELQNIQDEFKDSVYTPSQSIDADITDESEKIYNSGKFISYITEEFVKVWSGDTHILAFIMAMFANGFILNADESLHLYLSGKSGTGKSESAKHSLIFIPEEYVITAQFSKKGLLYHAEKYKPGSIVLHDDHSFSEEEAGLYRAMLAGWREPTSYNTVDGTTPKTIKIPQRINQIITSADGIAKVASEGQNESRFLTVEITRTPDQMQDIIKLIQNPVAVNDRTLKIILNVWSKITKEMVMVDIPFIQEIQVQPHAVYKIREFKKFLTLIKSVALLNGRTVATLDDFNQASKMWTYLLLMVNNEIPGLSKSEQAVFEKIPKGESKLSELKKLIPIPEASFYRAWYGVDGNFNHITGGLLSKVRGLRVESTYDKDTGKNDKDIHFSPDACQVGASPYTLKPKEEVRI